ncbi:MAG: tetratricopeptide repeat protein, partial [Planctomycetes bacterium]|nr:tetratricopeptide repeat protein [Planctomycetota bacterium]
PLPSLAEAKGALAEEKARFDDHLVMMRHFSATEQWDRAFAHLEQLEHLAADRPGVRWLRNVMLLEARRGEELKQRIFDEAGRLAETGADPSERGADDLYLANHLQDRARSICEANEQLDLLDRLQGVYRRQPSFAGAMPSWTRRRIDCLDDTGREAEAMALLEQLAADVPHDAGFQLRYARRLAGRGRHAEACAVLDRAIAADFSWHPYDINALHNTYARFLRDQGSDDALVEFLAVWVEKKPECDEAYEQYLTALICTGQIEKADELTARWMAEAHVDGELPADVSQRVHAAVSRALGQLHRPHSDRIEPRWLTPLVRTAEFLAAKRYQLGWADRIMDHERFRRTDPCRRLRERFTRLLIEEIDTLHPHQIEHYVRWLRLGDSEVELDVWKRIAAGVERRWSTERNPGIRLQLAENAAQILSGQSTADELLAFLRRRLEIHPNSQAHAKLFETLLEQPWSAELEDEALGLLENQAGAADAKQRSALQVTALHQLTDRMVQARYEARIEKIEDFAQLPPVERREQAAEAMQQAQGQFADRLRGQRDRFTGPLADWLDVERIYLEVLLERDLDRRAEECWEHVGPEPVALAEDATAEQIIEQLLRGRCLVMLCNLAVRPGANEKLVDRLLRYVDRGLAADDDAENWRATKFSLLVALDRPDDLRKTLKAWIDSDDPDNRWRLALGYLHAEQGKLAEAIQLFEAVEADDELGPDEYRSLADWYMVLDREEDHRRAVTGSYRAMDEYSLARRLRQGLRAWRDDDAPRSSDLDPDASRMFAGLLAKSSYPGNHTSLLQEYYQATRDFELLACLPESVVGHTAGGVYPFLRGLESVLEEVRKEATADSIVERLAEVRRGTESDVDRRALDLLELLTERRAAELLDQPGPHTARALAAMQRAFKGQWSPGEGRLMADFLTDLGEIAASELADEQVRQLTELLRLADASVSDRLHIAGRLAATHWNYGRHDEAIDLLQAAIEKWEDLHEGILPVESQGHLDTLISYLQQRGHHVRGEKILREQIGHTIGDQHRFGLKMRLYQLLQDALEQGSSTSLGSGATLYRALVKTIRDDLTATAPDRREELIGRLMSIYRAAAWRDIPGVAADLQAFAFLQGPDLLKGQTSNYRSIVDTLSQTLHDLADTRVALTFVIERLENEPPWFRYTDDGSWQSVGRNVALWRQEVSLPGDLETRLLALVRAELRRYLEFGPRRAPRIYYSGDLFWKAKAKDFAAVAEEVYEANKHSGDSIVRVADYLCDGPEQVDRAIEMLLDAHRRQLLEQTRFGVETLIGCLQGQGRHEESIPVLRALVQRQPNNLPHRIGLMRAFFHAGRHDDLQTLVDETRALIHKRYRWPETSEEALAALAKACVEFELYERAVEYVDQAIAFRRQSSPGRHVGDATLWGYYMHLAKAHAGLKHTAEAVDAACEAIVCWGSQHNRRAETLSLVDDVLRKSADLDGYVTQLDAQAAETERDNYVVRKAVGRVYLDGKHFNKAIGQLQLAVELQPNDPETHRMLIDCYQHQEKPEKAIGQLLDALQWSPHDFDLWEDLARRYTELDRPKEAERAYTSIVEVLPTES